MVQAGRNEPCPCGSGKKYKKCCGINKVVSISQLIDQEIIELQYDMIHRALLHNSDFEDEIDDCLDEFDIPDELEEVFAFHIGNWMLFRIPLRDGETAYLHYVKHVAKQIKRPQLRSALESWHKAEPAVVKIESMSSEGVMTVFDIVTEETRMVKSIEGVEGLEVGVLLLGMLIPYHDLDSFFAIPLVVPGEMASHTEKRIKDLLLFEDENENFLDEHWPDIVCGILLDDVVAASLTELEWADETHEQVASKVVSALQQEGYPHEVQQVATILWYSYCDHMSLKKVNNINGYAAALHYLIEKAINPFVASSQQELAGSYGVSAKTISKRYREMEDVLAEDLEALTEEMFEDDDDDFLF